MKKFWFFAILISIPIVVFSQTEDALKAFFEGKYIIPQIDLPGSTDGIYIYPERKVIFDYGDYGKDLKKYGIGAYTAEAIMITKVVVKKNHIRFELGGGGYGGIFSESTHVSAPSLSKSTEEINLEEKIEETTDEVKKKKLKKELESLRSERRAEQARLEMEAEHARAVKEERIANKRSSSGSRVHLKYNRRLTSQDLEIEEVIQNLAKYVILEEDAVVKHDESVVFQLKKGMAWGEANMMLGMPLDATTYKDGGLIVITCRYYKNGSFITAKFVEGLLVSYSTTSE